MKSRSGHGWTWLVASLAVIATLFGMPHDASAASDGPGSLARSTAGSTMTVDHGAFDKLLKSYVVPGKDGINRVDYPRFRSEGLAALKGYLMALQAADPTRLGPAEHFAYFANLYNAATLDVVLEHYPVKSIKAVRLADASGSLYDGPWKTKLTSVNGIRISLDEIASDILRPSFNSRDPRGHYLLNCLSIGCPNLLPEAITGAKLEAQLESATKAFVTHPRGVSVTGGKIKSSSLYSWYESDFGVTAGVIAHMAKFGGPELAKQLAGISAIAEHDYDWGLADATR